MKARNVGYWVATATVAFAFGVGGAFDVSGAPEVVAAIEHLGYPGYFAVLIGVWKLLGAVAVLVPRFPRVKEWAYAGMFFDLTGASISHAAAGDGAKGVLTPLVVLAFVVASYLLRSESRRLAAAPESQPEAERRLATA
jgi:hypothetical protein